MFSNKKNTLLYASIFLAVSLQAHGMENKQNQEFHSIIMPGLNGGGGADHIDNNVVNTLNPSRYTPLKGWNIDLGQGNCIRDFERQFNQDTQAKNKQRLFFGISQGTATLTNWLAQKSHSEQEKAAKLLVLEGVLGSGNSAIMHNAHSYAHPLITYLPFARAWIPFVAKVFFPTYNPFGKQAICSAKKLSRKLPVVILHNKKDPETPINDAREYYCTLREQGNNNAYLMEVDNGAAHFDVLSQDYRRDGFPGRNTKIEALQAIYRQHDLPTAPSSEATSGGTPKNPELALQYQPSVQEVRHRISQTNGYKNFFRNSIDLVSSALILGGIWWKYFSKK